MCLQLFGKLQATEAVWQWRLCLQLFGKLQATEAVWQWCLCLQLFGKLQATKAEIQDLQEEHTKERQELEQTLMELTRELKLK